MFVWVSLKWAASIKAGTIPAGPMDSNRRDINRRLERQVVSEQVSADVDGWPSLFNAGICNEGINHEVPMTQERMRKGQKMRLGYHTHG